MSHGSTLASELHFLWRALRERWLWALLAVQVAAGAAAYLVPFAYTLDIGGSPGALLYDRPYLQGFNDDPEYDVPSAPTQAFRWASPDARLRFPGVGRGLYLMALGVAAGQPGVEPAATGIWRGDTPLTSIPLAQAPRVYHVLVPATGGDLRVRFQTRPFQAGNDPRLLAFAADRVRVVPATRTGPDARSLAWLGGCTLLGYLLLRHSGVPSRRVALAGAGVALGLAYLLAVQRLGLTTFAPRLFVALALAYLGAAVLPPLLEAAARGLGLRPRAAEIRIIAGLAMVAWVIRLAGLLHPQAHTSDLGLNVNNLLDVSSGRIIFTEGLPSEAGAGQAPYPPGQYLTLLPLSLFVDGAALITAANALADSLMIVWGWLLLRSAGATASAALFAGTLYLFAIPLLVSLSKGEMANVWGQSLVGPLFVALTGWHAGKLRWWVLSLVLSVAFLGHSGVLLSLGAIFAVYLALLLIERGPWQKLLLVLLVALGASVLVYYSAFIGVDLGRSRVAVPFGGGRLRAELLSAVAPRGFIGPILAPLGLAGLIALWRRRQALSGSGLPALLLAWWLGTLLSLGTLLWTQQAVRWQAMLFPAVALGGGVALAALARRGKAGQILAHALLAACILRGITLWYVQIATYLH